MSHPSRRLTLTVAALVTSTAATLAIAGPSATASPTAASAGPATSVVTVVRPPLHLARNTYYRPAGRVPLPPTVTARSWVVADLDTGAILGTHLRHNKLPQASTIKLLTALTAADTVAARPAHRVSRSEAHPASCTCAGLVVGQRYTRTALLAGMLLPSGNDAAEALAGSHPRGRAAFVAAANRKAAALGARDTVMVTPSGLTARGAHSSASDLLVLLRAAQASPVVRPILGMSSYRLGPVGGRTHVVRRATDYVNKYPSAQGKSGYTTAARNTLVVNTPINGRHIGVALLGAPYGKSTSGARALTLWASANRSRLAVLAHLPGSSAATPAPTSTPTPTPTSTPTPVSTPVPAPSPVVPTIPTKDTFVPVAGAEFGDPTASHNRILDRLMENIAHTPSGATIQIVGYSFSLTRVSDALTAAFKRGVHVQVVVNSHSSQWGPAKRLVPVLGSNPSRSSFFVLAHGSARGTGGVTHEKAWTFSQVGRTPNVVMIGSTNLTGYGTGVQFSDNYTYTNRADVYKAYASMFAVQKLDKPVAAPYVVKDFDHGSAYFFPKPGTTEATDPVVARINALPAASDTVIRVSQFAWWDNRGRWIARALAAKARAGATIEVVAGESVGSGIQTTLRSAGIPVHSAVYKDGKRIHTKLMMAEWKDDTGTPHESVWTGSDNWADQSFRNEETMLRIDDDAVAYDAYVGFFDMLSTR